MDYQWGHPLIMRTPSHSRKRSKEGRRSNMFITFEGGEGAGKSTAMNLMTGYFPPTEGLVFVGGKNMLAEPRRWPISVNRNRTPSHAVKILP